FYITALLFLLSVDGHHLLIDGIFFSYEFIPLDTYIPFENESIFNFIIVTFNYMFLIAFQMSIPIVGCLFIVEHALVIIASTVPVLCVFVVGLSLKIFVSYVAIFVFFGLYITLVQKLFTNMFHVMHQLMQLFGGA